MRNSRTALANTLSLKQEHNAMPELEILRPDGSWKPVASCIATPEQLGNRLPTFDAIDGFIAQVRQNDLSLESVVATIRQKWNR